ncbi:MAG: Crp/Fnr family transcriptional regulator [Dehalococcoidia bacterium]|nr:Crp/Fnr family transcriptional regulator [Dehalococcoidia bacterium]
MPATGNQILDALPDEEFAAISGDLERHSLARGTALIDPYQTVTWIEFPIDAVISITTQTERGEPIEIAMVGSEGLFGSWVARGLPWSPWWGVCQVEGEAWRLPASTFSGRVPDLPHLEDEIRRYELVQAFMMSQSVLCNRFHDLVQRTARWLLVMSTKTPKDPLPLTQEFLSQMLGAHRPSVTLALQTLSEAGLIESVARGQIRVRDRGPLESVSCECFRAVADFSDRVMAPGDGGTISRSVPGSD